MSMLDPRGLPEVIEVGPWETDELVFASGAPVEPGSVVTVLVQSRRVFMPRGMKMDHAVATAFSMTSIKVGVHEQMITKASGVPAAVFNGAEMMMDTMMPRTVMEISARNDSREPRVFKLTVTGFSTDEKTKKETP